MLNIANPKLKQLTSVAELSPVIISALFPLFFDLSYQINLYMIWEGAYRLSENQIPYRDFGIPMGFYGWAMPALFFKMLGPSLYTLAKTQALMNIIAGISFRWILLRVGVSFYARILSLVVFTLTYVLGLYWPQYNHTVIIFQLVGFGFLFEYLAHPEHRISWVHLIISAAFLTISFFTKQDAGALAIIIALVIIIYHSFSIRASVPALIFVSSVILFFSLNILPFLKWDFTYWFNFGQAPHYSRVSLHDILRIILEESRWEKIYLVLVLGVFLYRTKTSGTSHLENLFTIFTLGILGQAMLFQVTSYVPKDNNIFFHSFFCAYIFYFIFKSEHINSWKSFGLLVIMVCLWWSEKYWKYADRIISKVITKPTPENVVSINTYILEPELCNYYADVSGWQTSPKESFKHVRMPASTVKGIEASIQLIKNYGEDSQTRVLNMSELTPLAYEAGYELEKGPLWFHLGVGLFDREQEIITSKIRSHYYDVVLFENIPMLNNFYPFQLRDALLQEYELNFTFDAPRIVYPGTIEVYSRKK